MSSKSLEEQVQDLYALVEELQSNTNSEEQPLVEIVHIADDGPSKPKTVLEGRVKGRDSEKHRIHVILDEASKNRISFLLEKTETSGKSALIRRALKILEMIVLAEAEGAQVCFLHSDGTRSVIRLV